MPERRSPLDAATRAEARQLLDGAVVRYQGEPVGTLAAADPEAEALNYDQCFVRDFVPAGLYYLAEGEPAIVRGFLETTRALQAAEHTLDCYRPGEGLIPASFAVTVDEDGREQLVPDYGGHAIGRVAPVDSGLWWLYLLRAYQRLSGDTALAARELFQVAMRRILELCLVSRFDMYPTLLVPDGSFMVDRRLGVYGYPLEVQALFWMALRAADELLTEEAANEPYRAALRDRLGKLGYYVRSYYWLDAERLNAIHRFDTEEYGAEAVNVFNVFPGSIPDWLPEWLPEEGGYLVGNVGPARLDFRFFTQGNLLAALSGLATAEQSAALLELLTRRSDDLLGAMPLKLCFPAYEGRDWELVTGHDPKNTPWSYHNGGSWPVLLWPLAAVAAGAGRPELARAALQQAVPRLRKASWAEYFDGRGGRLVGKQARRYQTWSLAGPLLAERLLTDPTLLEGIGFPADVTGEACPL
jgi:hypothetical protein